MKQSIVLIANLILYNKSPQKKKIVDCELIRKLSKEVRFIDGIHESSKSTGV